MERLESEKRTLDGTMIIAESRFSSPIPALSRRPHPLLKCWSFRDIFSCVGAAFSRREKLFPDIASWQSPSPSF